LSGPSEATSPARQALSVLGVRRFVLAIHDQSFPSRADEDLGRGSPYGRGARDLLAFVARCGFDGVQLGPQGDTTLDNPSPYDGALFTKSPLSIAVATLADDQPQWQPLTADLLAETAPAQAGPDPAQDPAEDPGRDPQRVRYRAAWHRARALLGALHARFAAAPARFPDLAQRFATFRRAHTTNLESDGLYQALVIEHGTDDWRRWPAPDRALSTLTPARRAWLLQSHAQELDRHAFGQFVLAEQHLALRRALSHPDTALSLFGDLPIGFSHRDLWTQGALFRRDYVMGAPPSRTNPDGQPWGFPVLDPDQYFAEDAAGRQPGPVLRLLVGRVDPMLRDFDGLRIDHPHGLVCPWVYAADDPEPAVAVSRGARLFCSPHLSDHPTLGRLAIPEAEQLSADPGIARYADDWVRELRDEQVARYGALFDAIMGRVAAAGRRASDVVCEVLSTWPYPLRRVMERYDLGRFCVLQKADLTRATDVYRAENVAGRDWIMVGNHDTRPIWTLAESWHGTAAGAQWAGYLAELLVPPPPVADTDGPARVARRGRLARWLSLDARHLCHGMFAALFASRASHVSIFFADLFGLRETYNRPGIVHPDNWTLRLPSDWQARQAQRLRTLDALNLPLSLALALLSLSGQRGPAATALMPQVLAAARAQTPLLDEDITSLLASGGDEP
jgi:4-alpha-glucanotransferase